MLAISPDERLTAARRAKLAYIYVRQSSVNQVKHHQESTELQYRLVDRAIGLGWPRERVQVIDDDLGKSGAGRADRQGFQRLIAEIGLGNAGLVISLDASRLARNNRDWHQLLELCSLFGVVIADGERLYDPSAYHDRLLTIPSIVAAPTRIRPRPPYARKSGRCRWTIWSAAFCWRRLRPIRSRLR
jgi:DNA invertase Pin-like site-specific DNA recombinase